MNGRHITIIVSIVVFSFVFGIIFNDITLGFLALSSGSINIYLQAKGKSSNYIFGSIYNLVNAYISYINNLYGLFILSLLLYLPLNIMGFISWNKSKNDNNEVEFRKFERKKSIMIIITSILTSILFGTLLGINPKQKLEFLDATSNILNIFGMILLNKRLNEGWYILLGNNIVDLLIWFINLLNNTQNAKMMFIVSIIYLIINIYGIYKWKNCKIKMH